MEVLLLVPVERDHDRLMRLVHRMDLALEQGAVLLDALRQVAVRFHLPVRIGDDHRDGRVVLHHLQVEAQVPVPYTHLTLPTSDLV